MICALILDREGPAFEPDKHIFGRPLAVYPLMAANASHHVKRTFLITDAPRVKTVALQHNTIILDPPASRETDKELLELGLQKIREDLKGETPLELLVLLDTHAPAVTAELLDRAIDILLEKESADSIVSVSQHDSFHPTSARHETPEGWLEPLASPPPKPQPNGPWFPDRGFAVLRPRCLESLSGKGPRPWLGQKVLPFKQEGTAPVDNDWQVPLAEFWLKKAGITDLSEKGLQMQPLPKPLPKPKGRR